MSRAQRKPVELHVYDGKHHIPAEELAEREDAEIKMGDLNFKAPDDIKKNKLALKKWKEVTKIYQDAGLTVVSTTDTGAIARYCILYAEYWELQEQRRQIGALDFPANDEAEIMAETDAEYRR